MTTDHVGQAYMRPALGSPETPLLPATPLVQRSQMILLRDVVRGRVAGGQTAAGASDACPLAFFAQEVRYHPCRLPRHRTRLLSGGSGEELADSLHIGPVNP